MNHLASIKMMKGQFKKSPSHFLTPRISISISITYPPTLLTSTPKTSILSNTLVYYWVILILNLRKLHNTMWLILINYVT